MLVENSSDFQNIVNIISEHKNHLSILKIKNKMHFNQLNTPNNPFCQITKDRLISYLKALDLKKGTDKLTPTLITLHKMCKR